MRKTQAQLNNIEEKSKISVALIVFKIINILATVALAISAFAPWIFTQASGFDHNNRYEKSGIETGHGYFILFFATTCLVLIIIRNKFSFIPAFLALILGLNVIGVGQHENSAYGISASAGYAEGPIMVVIASLVIILFSLLSFIKFKASMSKTFIASVFLWMFAALAITSIVAYYCPMGFSFLVSMQTGGVTTLGYVVMFAPIGFVLAMSLGFKKFSYPVILFLFLLYSAVMGLSLSFIFLLYTNGSIFQTFAAAAAMFGLMSVVGYTTQTDLTKFGSIMMMGLIGIIVAFFINWFFNSCSMNYIISFIGVLVFTGLTAYNVQKLKRIGAGVEFGLESTSKLAILGASLILFLVREKYMKLEVANNFNINNNKTGGSATKSNSTKHLS